MAETVSAFATTTPAYWAVVPAAGNGVRMGGGVPKQYLQIGDKTLLALTLERLCHVPQLSSLVLVLHPEDDRWESLDCKLSLPIRIAAGGDSRCRSVYNGLMALAGEAADSDWVLVHDAARPCARVADMQRLIHELAADEVGGVLARPVSDTLKQVDADMRISGTLDRDACWLAATPQLFRYGLLRQALAASLDSGKPATDEAGALELAGYPVRVVPGSADNIKITHPEDLALAAHILASQAAG